MFVASAGTFPPFDPSTFASQLFWLTITFGVLYFLLSLWILPRIGSAIEERRDRIADDLDAAAQMKAQADEAERAYEKSLADARAKAQATAEAARADMDRDIAEEIAQIDRELAARSQAAEDRIRESKTKALAEVRTIAASAASGIVARIANLEVSESDAAKAVDAKA